MPNTFFLVPLLAKPTILGLASPASDPPCPLLRQDPVQASLLFFARLCLLHVVPLQAEDHVVTTTLGYVVLMVILEAQRSRSVASRVVDRPHAQLTRLGSVKILELQLRRSVESRVLHQLDALQVIDTNVVAMSKTVMMEMAAVQQDLGNQVSLPGKLFLAETTGS